MNEPDMMELLAGELDSISPATEASSQASGKLGTKQFTLLSLPFLTVYLQGAPRLPAPDLAEFTFSWAARAGILKSRLLGYQLIPVPVKKGYQSQLLKLAQSDQLFSPVHLEQTKRLLMDYPELVTSAGGLSSLREKALNPARAAQAVSDWYEVLPYLPLPGTAGQPEDFNPDALNSLDFF